MGLKQKVTVNKFSTGAYGEVSSSGLHFLVLFSLFFLPLPILNVKTKKDMSSLLIYLYFFNAEHQTQGIPNASREH